MVRRNIDLSLILRLCEGLSFCQWRRQNKKREKDTEGSKPKRSVEGKVDVDTFLLAGLQTFEKQPVHVFFSRLIVMKRLPEVSFL